MTSTCRRRPKQERRVRGLRPQRPEDRQVTEKRPVVKEELRICKDVVQDEEIVEEDVRKEEVDVDDQTTTRHQNR